MANDKATKCSNCGGSIIQTLILQQDSIEHYIAEILNSIKWICWCGQHNSLKSLKEKVEP